MGRVSSQILADRLAEKDAQLARLQAKAVEDGDQSAVDRVVKERLELKSKVPAQDDGIPAETRDFTERHKSWFGQHPRATALAKRIAAELAQEGFDVTTQLREAEAEVKRVYPDLFGRPAKPAPATQTANARAVGTGSREKGFADMPKASQDMALDYERRHGIKKEDFAASYWADEAKKQRRA